jgi:hypothetical protein
MTDRIAGSVGTKFAEATTNQAPKIPPGQVPAMMSEAGEALASVTAPSDAFVVRTTSTSAVKNQ